MFYRKEDREKKIDFRRRGKNIDFRRKRKEERNKILYVR